MDIVIQKWGNSLGLRIPSIMARELNIQKGCHVDLKIENNKLIIIPKQENKRKLENLLLKINKYNIHQEIDTGAALGNEVW